MIGFKSLCPMLQNYAKLRPMLFAALVGLMLWVLSPMKRIDDVWSDLLLACQAKPAEGNVILLAISAEDVINHGQERLSRKFLAETLNILQHEKVKRILLDFNLGAGVTPNEEAMLRAAMMYLGPDRVAIAYEPDASLRTKSTLLQYATTVDLAFTPDTDGRLRVLNKSSLDSQPNPFAWLHEGISKLQPTILDRRIDPASIPKFSLTELHQGRFPTGAFEDKLVVISTDPKLSRTVSQLPLHGRMDRGTILAMATESRIGLYDQRVSQTNFISLLAHIVLSIGGYLIGAQAPNVKRAVWGAFWIATLALAFSWTLCVLHGVPSRPGTILLATTFSLYIALAYRLKVIELLAGLLSGVLSPEEVWLWRVYGERKTPVVLFDAMGHIKRANPQALEVFKLSVDQFSSQISPLARSTMPNLGERRESLEWLGTNKSIWTIDWPSQSLPLAIFTDVTTQQEELARLHTQLYTDPLTGEANRAGFEKALTELDAHVLTNYAIIFMDMNGFKAVNDTYGHDAGDTLLKIAGQRFRKVIGPEPVLARLGGDEFAIILRNCSAIDVVQDMCQELESSLGAEIDLGKCSVKVGVAAGFATQQSSAETTACVLRRADLAMYERKAFLKSRPPLASMPIHSPLPSLKA